MPLPPTKKTINCINNEPHCSKEVSNLTYIIVNKNKCVCVCERERESHIHISNLTSQNHVMCVQKKPVINQLLGFVYTKNYQRPIRTKTVGTIPLFVSVISQTG